MNNNFYFLDIPENNNDFLIEVIKNNFNQESIFPYHNCDQAFKNLHKDFIKFDKYNFYYGKFGIGFRKNFKDCNLITSINNPFVRINNIVNKILNGKYNDYKIHLPESSADILNLIEKNKFLFSNVQTKFLALDFNPLKLNFENIRMKNCKFLFERWQKINVDCNDEIFKNACENLKHALFFGLSEKQEDFLNKFFKIMNFKFNWEIKDLLENYKLYQKFKNDEYSQIIKYNNIFSKKSDNIKKLLIEYNKFDIKLYNFAKKIYDKKFKNMKFYI